MPLAVYAQSKPLTMFAGSLAEFSPGRSAWSTRAWCGCTHIPACRSPEPRRSSLSCAPTAEVANGAYYDELTIASPARYVDDPNARGRLRKLSARLTTLD